MWAFILVCYNNLHYTGIPQNFKQKTNETKIPKPQAENLILRSPPLAAPQATGKRKQL
jgi:hypothetical protein